MSNYNSNYSQGNGYPPNGGGQQYQNNGGYGGEASTFYGNTHQPYAQHESFMNQGSNPHDQGPPQYQQYPSAAAHSSNSGRASHNQAHQNGFNGAGDPEGDRGIMGGLAGGAAGAFGGHALGGKAGHGTSGTILGAIAGAWSGHKAQDKVEDWRDERKEKKEREEWEKQNQGMQNQQGGYQGQGSCGNQGGGGYNSASHGQHQDRRRSGDFGANFSASSRDVRLEHHTLHAQCRRRDGAYQSSCINLSSVLTTDNGSFRWQSSSSNHNNGSSTYTVQPGDTLRAIASRFAHCSYEDLARTNNIANADMIYPGQNLVIPSGGGSRDGSAGGGLNGARGLRLADGGQKLVGEVDDRGRWVQREIVLDERIANREGCLEFV